MKPLPIIGFDRYVPRHWLDAALAAAVGEADRTAVVSLLADEVVGVEARSKTMIILNRIWLSPHPTLVSFAAAGSAICEAKPDINRLPLHWGMALASHPFFATVADTIGKLLKLHGEFTSLQVNRRLKEQLGDRASVLRATEAVMQTLIEWGAIQEAAGRKRTFIAGQPVAVKSTAASMWLLEACLRATGRTLALGEKSNLLFALRTDPLRESDFARQSRLRLTTSGAGSPTVSLAKLGSGTS
jgi:hypothetical protein